MKRFFLALIVMLMSLFGTLAVTPSLVMAVNNSDDWSDACSKIPDEVKEAAGCSESGTLPGEVSKIYNVIIGIVGILAVVVIIISGVIMMTSAGDPSKVAKGKKGIIYGIVGLVISLLAYAIVNFVLSNVF